MHLFNIHRLFQLSQDIFFLAKVCLGGLKFSKKLFCFSNISLNQVLLGNLQVVISFRGYSQILFRPVSLTLSK